MVKGRKKTILVESWAKVPRTAENEMEWRVLLEPKGTAVHQKPKM